MRLKEIILPVRQLAVFFCVICLLVTLAAPAQSAEYESAFSPGGALPLVLKAIHSAQSSIHVAAYSFTSRPVAEALTAASKRGLDVKVIADAKANSGKYTAVTYLANQKVPVRLNGRYAIHHHKFIIVDGKTVQTGSFNYSASAVSKNAENVLVVWNAFDLAGQYEDEWQRLWGEGIDVKPNY